MSVVLKQKPAVKSETIADAFLALKDGENCDLPMLPEVAAQLLTLTNDVDCNASDIVTLIKRDQSLTSHLLRTANSVRYNTGVAVSSVQQAVARLGLLAVREIVVLISCKCRVFDVPEFESHVRRSFRHSLTTAAFSQEIARTRRVNVEEAFLAGLLHDVGRPVLFQALVDRRKTHGLTATDNEVLIAANEHRIPLAARLIKRWEMSERIVETVLHQSTPLDAPSCQMQAATLNLAIHLSNLALNPATAESTETEPHPMLEALSIYPEQFAKITQNRNQILEWVDSTI